MRRLMARMTSAKDLSVLWLAPCVQNIDAEFRINRASDLIPKVESTFGIKSDAPLFEERIVRAENRVHFSVRCARTKNSPAGHRLSHLLAEDADRTIVISDRFEVRGTGACGHRARTL